MPILKSGLAFLFYGNVAKKSISTLNQIGSVVKKMDGFSAHWIMNQCLQLFFVGKFNFGCKWHKAK